MMPIIASALLSVAGQFAFKWISSAFTSSKAAPSGATPSADAPKDNFAALLQQSQKSPGSGNGAAGAPLLLASAAPVLPVAPVPSSAPVAAAPAGSDAARAGRSTAIPDLLSAADAYQRVHDFQAP